MITTEDLKANQVRSLFLFSFIIFFFSFGRGLKISMLKSSNWREQTGHCRAQTEILSLQITISSFSFSHQWGVLCLPETHKEAHFYHTLCWAIILLWSIRQSDTQWCKPRNMWCINEYKYPPTPDTKNQPVEASVMLLKVFLFFFLKLSSLVGPYINMTFLI